MKKTFSEIKIGEYFRYRGKLYQKIGMLDANYRGKYACFSPKTTVQA